VTHIDYRPEHYYLALLAARKRKQTIEYKIYFAFRAGVAGTISRALCHYGLRQSRYYGLAKTHLQYLIAGAALNILRVAYWLLGVPIPKASQSPYK
jgi:transposase